MAVVLLLAALALLSFPGLARPLGRRLNPSEWARLGTVVLGGGALALEAGLVILAAPTALHSLGVSGMAAACRRMMGGLAPGGAVAGWVATAGAVAGPAMAWRGLARARATHRRMRAEPWLGSHRHCGSCDLVVLQSDKVLAVSVAGPPHQVVLTTALMTSLTPEQLAAVVRHEHAHLVHRHQRLLVALAVVDASIGWFPPVRASTAAVRLALERWADEDAAGASVEGRRAVRDALLGVAAAMAVVPEVAAFSSGIESLVERAKALQADAAPPGRPARVAVWSPTLGLAVLNVLSLGNWLMHVRMMLPMACLCRA
jgi:Zn-dependent protease with chaperone function